MNIKSLLLGSAAAMVAVSGAQAADAVVVEPEPVEYVRVCDAYGSGFFYIPGTETCLNFNGYVRVLSIYEDDNLAAAAADNGSHLWVARARFNIDARNETEWGTLRSQIRLQSDQNGDGGGAVGGPSSNRIEIDRALISIGGLRVGISDNYWTTNHGYAGVNASGWGINLADDGVYGFSNNMFLDYTYAMDGLAITVGVEDRDEGIIFAGAGNANTGGTNGQGNFYAGVNYSGDGWGMAFTYASDDNSTAANKGDAYKVSADLDLSEFIPGGSLHGMYMWEDMDVAQAAAHATSYVGADNVWQVSFQMNLADNVELWAQYSDLSDIGHVPGVDGDVASIGVNWYPVSGLKVLASYTTGQTTTAGVTTADRDSYLLGIRRSF